MAPKSIWLSKPKLQKHFLQDIFLGGSLFLCLINYFSVISIQGEGVLPLSAFCLVVLKTLLFFLFLEQLSLMLIDHCASGSPRFPCIEISLIISSSKINEIAFFFSFMGGTIFWPNQHDRMNVTKKFVHDRKDHTDKHERWKLTEKVWKQRTWRVSVIFMGISVIFSHLCSSV